MTREELRQASLCRECWSPLDTISKIRCTRCARKHTQQEHNRNVRLRLEVLSSYGSICTCCGESNFNCLSIDHMNGNGREHRKELARGGEIWKWLKDHKYPKGFQILCFNCNMLKYQAGVCIHQRKSEYTIQMEWLRRSVCSFCGSDIEVLDNKFYQTKFLCQKCQQELGEEDKKYYSGLFGKRLQKVKAISNYGEWCRCCGENYWLFLSLDHINNDGAQHRKEIRNNYHSLSNWAVRNNYPNSLQVLCYNCNCGQGFFGECHPKQKELEVV